MKFRFGAGWANQEHWDCPESTPALCQFWPDEQSLGFGSHIVLFDLTMNLLMFSASLNVKLYMICHLLFIQSLHYKGLI